MPPEQLAAFVRGAQAQGMSIEDIYRELLARNCSIANIQAGVAAAEGEARGEDSQKRVVRIMLIFGAILIGAGIFSFIASNWSHMPRELKVAVIVGAMLVTNILGWLLREKYDYEKTGEALLLLGSLMYGGGIFLVGQMYNVRANWPDGFILWMLGTIVMAFAADSHYLFKLGLPIAAVALVGHPLGIYGNWATYSGYIFTSTLLLSIATLTTFATGYVMRRKAFTAHPELLS